MARKNSTTIKTPLADRLNYVMQQMGWNKAELARACEASEQSTVGNWLSGRNKSMEPVFAFRLQDKYFWNARWLLDGEPWPPRLPILETEKKRILDVFGSLPIERLRAIASALGL